VGIFVKLLSLHSSILALLKETGYELPDNEEEVMVKKKETEKVPKRGVTKGDVYKCGVCGLAVTVDEVCGCVDYCDIICCEKQMKPKKRA
jgi:hypothetical protein